MPSVNARLLVAEVRDPADADLGVGAFYSDAEAGRGTIGVGVGEFGAICDVVGGAELAGDVFIRSVDLGDLRDRKIDAAP